MLAGVKEKICGKKNVNETETESLVDENTIEESVEDVDQQKMDMDHQVVDMDDQLADLGSDD